MAVTIVVGTMRSDVVSFDDDIIAAAASSSADEPSEVRVGV